MNKELIFVVVGDPVVRVHLDLGLLEAEVAGGGEVFGSRRLLLVQQTRVCQQTEVRPPRDSARGDNNDQLKRMNHRMNGVELERNRGFSASRSCDAVHVVLALVLKSFTQ